MSSTQTFLGGDLVPENFRHMTSTPRDAGSDGAGREFEGCRYFGVIHANDVPEHEGGPELFSQKRNGVFERHSIGDLLVDLGPLADAIGVIDHGDRSPLSTSEFIEAGVACYPVAPCPEGRTAVEPFETADDGEKCLLTGISGIGIVASHPPANGEETFVVPAKQEVERGSIAPLCPFHQLFVRTFDGLSLRHLDLEKFESMIGACLVIAILGEPGVGHPEQHRGALYFWEVQIDVFITRVVGSGHWFAPCFRWPTEVVTHVDFH